MLHACEHGIGSFIDDSEGDHCSADGSTNDTVHEDEWRVCGQQGFFQYRCNGVKQKCDEDTVHTQGHKGNASHQLTAQKIFKTRCRVARWYSSYVCIASVCSGGDLWDIERDTVVE